MTQTYRVKVETHVVVNARNLQDAKARGEQGVRLAVKASYRDGQYLDWADGWDGFGFEAKKAARWEDGADE